MNGTINKIFTRKALIGMIHLLPLPGSPNFKGNLSDIREAALFDMQALISGGADGFIIENFGDVPYDQEMNEAGFAVMASICQEIACKTSIPFGINIQFNQYKQEWALAYAIHADFIRVEAFVEHRVGIHGISNPVAPELMRLKTMYPSKTMIFADINSKHTYPLVNQPIDFSVHSAIESGANAIIITGLETGKVPTVEEVKEIKLYTSDVPLFIGSGIDSENIKSYTDVCDGVIVGSSIKVDGDVYKRVDQEKVKELKRILTAQ